jgi:sulfite exporter TauE/SafE
MCGGIAASFSPALAQRTTQDKFLLSLIFNLGRICSYMIAGMFAGTLSYVLGNELNISYWSEILRFLTGLFITLIGLSLMFQLKLPQAVEHIGIPVWRKIAPLTQALKPVKGAMNGFLLGILWGWIPCGMTYSMLLVSLMSDQPLHGALIMGSFGLGTLPALVIGGVLFARIGQLGRRFRIHRYAGALFIVLGLWTALAPHLPMPQMQQHPLSANSNLCETEN